MDNKIFPWFYILKKVDMNILRPQNFLSNLYLQKSLFSEYITGRRLWEKLYTETQKTDMSGLLMLEKKNSHEKLVKV